MTLFDQQNLAEITPPRLPRRTPRRLPQPAARRGTCPQTRELLAATEKLLAPIAAAVAAGRLVRRRQDRASRRQGDQQVQDGQTLRPWRSPTTAWPHPHAAPDRRGGRPGWHLRAAHLRPGQRLDAAGVVTAYKNLDRVERDFRSIKANDLDLRPIYHRPEPRHSPRADLHARLLPRLAPAPGLGAADLHRRTPTRAPQSRRPGPPLTQAAAKASRQHDPAITPTAASPPPRRPRHPHPQPGPLHRHHHHSPHARRRHR